ncbi:hypothetical protein [Bradyrhizobium centrosematis]|uniref:hypothetical protein n=1 Tax=Bradyrhizobium centrosematis TaxID=1300039 RepID=UPI002169F4FF|nr:hypothetical protein [Bradyrhizobium centrosematis]MCS3765275.1 hypothetical protein [Bradyrhizobium centrosematis]MCS3774026.1 hypothetical protein [Bradyrhizobium centrosematis]
MAKRQYSADSAPLPQSYLPPDGNKMGTFESLHLRAPFSKGTSSVPTTFVITGTNAYIGENVDLRRRIPEHYSVRRKTGHSGTYTPTPISID